MDLANNAKHAIERIAPRSLKHLSYQLQALVEGRLWLKVLIGMVLGVAIGVVLGPSMGWVPGIPARLWEIGSRFRVRCSWD